MDADPNRDENQHMRVLLLRLDKRLVELSQEMGVQENINRVLRQEERELEENLEERENRLAEAHEVDRHQREKRGAGSPLHTAQPPTIHANQQRAFM